MATDDEKDLNFKVDVRFHTEFKYAATRHRISMKELLEDCFTLWLGHKDRQHILALMVDPRKR